MLSAGTQLSPSPIGRIIKGITVLTQAAWAKKGTEGFC